MKNFKNFIGVLYGLFFTRHLRDRLLATRELDVIEGIIADSHFFRYHGLSLAQIQYLSSDARGELQKAFSEGAFDIHGKVVPMLLQRILAEAVTREERLKTELFNKEAEISKELETLRGIKEKYIHLKASLTILNL